MPMIISDAPRLCARCRIRGHRWPCWCGLYFCNVLRDPYSVCANPGYGGDFPKPSARGRAQKIESALRAALAIEQAPAIVDIESKLHRARPRALGREQVLHQRIGEALVAFLGAGAIDDPICREGARSSRAFDN